MVTVRVSLAEALWSAALVAGFAAGIGWWRPGSGGQAPAILFGQGLPVVIGAVALAHVASLVWFRAPPTASRRAALLLAIGLPVVVALALAALLAVGIALADPLLRLASFALYFKSDPPLSSADLLGLTVAFVVAVPLTLTFVVMMRILMRSAAPAFVDALEVLEAAHYLAGLFAPAMVLLWIELIPAALPPAVAYIVAATASGALLGTLARRALAASVSALTSAVRAPLNLAIGTLAFALLGLFAGIWADLP